MLSRLRPFAIVRLWPLLVASIGFACSQPTSNGPDSGRNLSVDGGVLDGSFAADSGEPTSDGGMPDASGPDAGSSSDGGTPSDGGVTDGGGVDGGGVDAGVVDAGPPLWDLPMIEDPTTANCTFSNQSTAISGVATYDTWDVTYESWQSVDGGLEPILIRAFAAKPTGATGLPGIVESQGLGGYATPSQALSLASTMGMFALAYTGPGAGNATDTPPDNSEGLSAGYDNDQELFNTVPDVRGSWFWAHAIAAMRAVTCLETRSDVDSTRLGVTGFSAGGVISLILAGVDPRIVASVPLSASHAWDVAVESSNAWELDLLSTAGYTTSSPQWENLQTAIIDPAATVAYARANVMMVDGASDEFFPLTSFMATYNAIPSTTRMTLSANFDHGCYLITGVESQQTIADRATAHATGAQVMWFNYWFGTDPDFAYVPATPTFEATTVGAGTYVVATVDPGGSNLTVSDVEVWASTDGDQVWAGDNLTQQSQGVYAALVPLSPGANNVLYVDVAYQTALGVQTVYVSSPPQIPAGFVPTIRPVSTCTIE